MPVGDLLPEGAQSIEPLFARVAGDDRGIDRADGDARHPIRLDIGFVQRFVDAGLIRAERAAALKNQRDLVAALGPPAEALGRPPRKAGQVRQD